MSRRASRARRSRRLTRDFPDFPVDIRVGSRRSEDQGQYLYLQVHGPNDAGRFAGLIDHTVRANPGDPILLICSGFQPYLEDVFSSCLDSIGSDRSELNRETHFADTLRFPESTYRRLQRRLSLPYTFIVDQINVPDVFYWSFRQRPPEAQSDNPPVDTYRFRIGCWTCSRGAYVNDRQIPVTILFVQNTDVSEHVATQLLFPYMYEDDDYNAQRSDEASVSYIFLKLFELLTDWQNVLREFEGHLDAAERNSRDRNLPVKYRTRTMHHQIDRIYELLLYQRFHASSFKKLSKLKPSADGGSTVSGRSKRGGDHDDEGDDPIWDEMDDETEELDQANYELNALQQRFDNLTELEFNIENASQSDSSRFLTVIATLFLPLSFLASIWGFTTFTGSPIQYLWAAIPVFFASALFVLVGPLVLRFIQRLLYPEEKRRLDMRPQDYSMLGADLPNGMDAPGAAGKPRLRRGKPREARRRSGLAEDEKGDDDHGRTNESRFFAQLT